MKKFAAIMMSALIGLPSLGNVALAQDRAPARKIEQQVPAKPPVKKQQWKKGGKYTGKGSRVSDHRRHNLKAPRKGYRWVRDGDDFLLVAIATGVIASIVTDR